MECNLLTCRNNAFGVCTSEEDRNFCVDVAKRVLCMEEDECDTEKIVKTCFCGDVYGSWYS